MAPFIYKEDPSTEIRWWRCDCPQPCVQWQCVRCQRKWWSYASSAVQCCGSYVKWVNYKVWSKKHPLVGG